MSNAALAELREMGGNEFVRDLVETFATNVAAYLARVNAGVRGGDPTDAAKAAHSIAGGAGQLGEGRLEATAREVEAALRVPGRADETRSLGETPEPPLAALLATLESEARRAVAALREAADE